MGCGCFNGTTDSAFLYDFQRSEFIKMTPKAIYFLIGKILGKENWILQKDNVAIETSHSIIDWFSQNKAVVIDWPDIDQ